MRELSANESWTSPISFEWVSRARGRCTGRGSREGVVERVLNASAVVLEPPHPVGRGPEDEEPHEALDREEPQEQLVCAAPCRAGPAARPSPGRCHAGRSPATNTRQRRHRQAALPRSPPIAAPAALAHPARRSHGRYGRSRTGSIPQPAPYSLDVSSDGPTPPFQRDLERSDTPGARGGLSGGENRRGELSAQFLNRARKSARCLGAVYQRLPSALCTVTARTAPVISGHRCQMSTE